MSQTYTVTKAKYAGEKDNPHGGKLHKFYCSFVDEAGNGQSDVYWQRKSEESPEGEQFYGRIEEGQFGPRFKTEQQQNGGPPRSGGSSGTKNDLSPEFWAARDRRLGRAGMMQAVVASGNFTTAQVDGHHDYRGFVTSVSELTDMLLADLQAKAPSPNSDADSSGGSQAGLHAPSGAEETRATASADPAGVSAERVGFASDKQQAFFERLLKDAGLTQQQIAEIGRYVRESLATDRVSKAIDAIKEGDRDKAIEALLVKTAEWHRQQSDVPWEDDGSLPPLPE